MAELAQLTTLLANPSMQAGVSIAQGGLGLAGGFAQASAAKRTAEFNRRELERAAGEARADASRKAMEQRRKGEMVASRQRAVAAGSGAGTTEGEGYLDIVGDTDQYNEFLIKNAIAGGENKAAGFLDKAKMATYEGDMKAGQAMMSGMGSFAQGLAGAGKVYVKNNPTGASYLDDGEVIADGSYGNNWVTTTRRTKPRGTYY